ncbi:sensor histidine kinase [Capilliphycus salinus ALCB114379]|uniref:sensor histidine kinase n=1 Tax=Capilliphycus salinus TaxID=2768948 RepID=UPI0039A6C9CD
MKIEAAINLVDKLYFQHTNQHLNSIQINLLRGVWLNQSYEELAEICYCSVSQVKMVGAKFWADLSTLFGEKVTKKTARAILESHYQSLKNGKIRLATIEPVGVNYSPPKHDNKNSTEPPTTSPSWFESELLFQLAEKLDSSLEKILSNCHADLGEIQSLSKQLQLIHCLSSYKYSLNRNFLDIINICRHIINNLTSKFTGRRIILSVFQEPILADYDLSISARVDSQLVCYILENLLTNALQYSDAESTITLDVNVEDQQGIFTVVDGGIGIPPDELERIFQPFYCATNSRQRSGGGLGLTIVEKSVKLHQGELSVSSQIERGSTFTVVLPVA